MGNPLLPQRQGDTTGGNPKTSSKGDQLIKLWCIQSMAAASQKQKQTKKNGVDLYILIAYKDVCAYLCVYVCLCLERGLAGYYVSGLWEVWNYKTVSTFFSLHFCTF